jgi:transcriptional regulator with XRE-family HTH domain
MPSGADIRKYRKALRLSQRVFAARLALSQATLSLTETGKIGVSNTVEEGIRKEFNKARYKPTFDEFCRRVDSERKGAQTLVGNPQVNHSTLAVWLWEDGFDLGSAPSTLEWRGVVTARVPSDDAIAFEMPKGSNAWAAGEILVFRRSSLEECRGGELCMVQVQPVRRRAPRTLIAVIRRDSGTRRRSFSLEPCDPDEATFTADPESIEALLVCAYRARYLT